MPDARLAATLIVAMGLPSLAGGCRPKVGMIGDRAARGCCNPNGVAHVGRLTGIQLDG